MRNKGLHRGAEFIRQTKEVLLHPNEDAIAKLCGQIGEMRLKESELWILRANAGSTAELMELEALCGKLQLEIETLMSELERKMILKRVFEHLIRHRATEVMRDMMDPALQLTHYEGMTLRDIEEYAYA
jgi:predicted kinase